MLHLQMWTDVFANSKKMDGCKGCPCLFRILVVKQTREVLSPLNNVTLVDVVMRSILPPSHHLLSPSEVADAIETHLQTREEDIWPSWTVRHIHTVNMIQY